MAGSGWVGGHVGGRAFETTCENCRILWPASTVNPLVEVRLLQPLWSLCGHSLRIAIEALVLASLRLKRSGREESVPVRQVDVCDVSVGWYSRWCLGVCAGWGHPAFNEGVACVAAVSNPGVVRGTGLPGIFLCLTGGRGRITGLRRLCRNVLFHPSVLSAMRSASSWPRTDPRSRSVSFELPTS